MGKEKVLVLIKPDALAKNLTGTIISEKSSLNLDMVAAKQIKAADK